MNFQNPPEVERESTPANRKKITRIHKPPSLMVKVMGQFGLKVHNQEIITKQEADRRSEVAQQGWKKVRNALFAIRLNKNAGLFYSSKKNEYRWPTLSYQIFLIYPQSTTKHLLMMLQSAIILYNILIVPFRYAFDRIDDDRTLINTDIVLDIIFALIILSHFFYVYNQKAHYVTEFRNIAMKYVLGIFSLDSDGFFFIDILANYPYYVHSNHVMYFLRFLRFLQTGLVLRGYTLFWKKLIRLFTSNINFTRSLTDILKFLLMLFLIAQCLACWWYYLGKARDVVEGYDHELDKPVYKSGWVYNLLYNLDPGAGFSTEYITSLYWVFTTLTTLGYGDYYGTTTDEYIFTMFVEFLGVFVFAYMMGNINILFEKLDDDHLEYLGIENEKLDQWLIMITRANETRRFKESFVDELRHRLNIYWQRDHSSVIKDYPFYRQLPFKLQQDVTQKITSMQLVDEIFGKFIMNFSVFFRGLEQQFIQAVVISLYPKQFLTRQGDVEIIPADTCPNEMYFITKGRVTVSTKAGDKYMVLPPRSYFGDHLILLKLKSSNIYLTSGEDVECMCINAERFIQLCDVYPYSMKLLKYKAFVRRRFKQSIKEKLEKIRQTNRRAHLERALQKTTMINSLKPLRTPTPTRGFENMLALDSPYSQRRFEKQMTDSVVEESIDQQDLINMSKSISESIQNIKTQITHVEKSMRSRMAQVKIDIEFITKYEEILQNFQEAV